MNRYTLQELLDRITIKATDTGNPSPMCAGNLWKCSLTYKSRFTGKTASMRFDFHTNKNNEKPSKALLLDCLLMDYSTACEYDNAEDLIIGYGYTGSAEQIREGFRVFKACQSQKNKLLRVFGSYVLAQLEEASWDGLLDEMEEGE